MLYWATAVRWYIKLCLVLFCLNFVGFVFYHCVISVLVCVLHSDGRSLCLFCLVLFDLVVVSYCIYSAICASLAFRLCCLVLSCLFFGSFEWLCISCGWGRGEGSLGKSFIHSSIVSAVYTYVSYLPVYLYSHHFNRAVSASPLSLACL